MKIKKKAMTLYAISARSMHEGVSLEDAIKAALDGGATFLQIREKDMTTDELIETAISIKKLAAPYGVPIVIDDNVEAVIKSGADGVHLGQGDMPVAEARKLLGDNKIIGITAKTVKQAQDAERDGADYLGSGALFATQTKEKPIYITKSDLIAICNSVSIPVVAIGGIKKENIPSLKGGGMSGFAVVSGIFKADNAETIKKSTEEYLAIIKEALK